MNYNLKSIICNCKSLVKRNWVAQKKFFMEMTICFGKYEYEILRNQMILHFLPNILLRNFNKFRWAENNMKLKLPSILIVKTFCVFAKYVIVCFK